MFVVALGRWMLIQAVLWGAALAWLATTNSRSEWQLVLVLGATASSYAALWRLLGAGRVLADYVTLGRFLLLLSAFGCAHAGPTMGWWPWLGCVAAVAADLLDGYCARRFGGSEAGAVLDMETDQFATLLLAWLLHQVVGVGAWVLLLPAYRYGFVLLSRLLQLPAHDPKPRDGDNSQARLICAAMMVLLLLGLMPGMPTILSHGAAGLALCGLTWSYGSDLWFLLRRRRGVA
ncbi:MAG: CDP-alcohol phosphatidyltransferase family protein [Planctomycetes bacterium]|nr:CDP-alcohol phosphatidyltransferase family protein [Planctomycetota bacterium]